MARKSNSKYLAGIAHHEAGHAVAAWFAGMRPRSMSIVPNDASAGRYVHHPYFSELGRNFEYEPTPKARLRLEKHALVCLAGGVAQKRFDPLGFRRADCRGDDEIFTQMVLFLTGGDSGEEFSAYAQLISVRTNNLINHPVNWHIIKSIAKRLLKSNELTGAEITATIDAAHASYHS